MAKFRGVRSSRFQLMGWDDRIKKFIIVQHITFVRGANLIGQKKADPVYDKDENIIGFRLRGAHSPKQKARYSVAIEAILAKQAKASCAAFSRDEVEAIAGLRGESRTLHLSEEKRVERIRMGWQAEDLVQAAREKLNVYASVH